MHYAVCINVGTARFECKGFSSKHNAIIYCLEHIKSQNVYEYDGHLYRNINGVKSRIYSSADESICYAFKTFKEIYDCIDDYDGITPDNINSALINCTYRIRSYIVDEPYNC